MYYDQVAVMAFNVLRGMALSYLDHLVRVLDLPGRRCLRSSTSQLLQILAHRALQLLVVARFHYLQFLTTVSPVVGFNICLSSTSSSFRNLSLR